MYKTKCLFIKLLTVLYTDCYMEQSVFNRTTLRESKDDPSSLTGQPHSASQLIHSWFVCPLQRNGPTAISHKILKYDLGHPVIWPVVAVNYLYWRVVVSNYWIINRVQALAQKELKFPSSFLYSKDGSL